MSLRRPSGSNLPFTGIDLSKSIKRLNGECSPAPTDRGGVIGTRKRIEAGKHSSRNDKQLSVYNATDENPPGDKSSIPVHNTTHASRHIHSLFSVSPINFHFYTSSISDCFRDCQAGYPYVSSYFYR